MASTRPVYTHYHPSFFPTSAPEVVTYSTTISIPLGILVGLLTSFIQSLGLTIQRKSHVLNQRLPEHRRSKEYQRPLWLLGLAIFVTSNLIGSFVQIASLPVVILAPLGAVSLLWNALFARFILGDVFSPRMILGTILIAGGAVLIAMFGVVPEPTRSLDDLLQLFRQPVFIAYFSTLGVVVFLCLMITHITEFSHTRQRELVHAASPLRNGTTALQLTSESMANGFPTNSACITTGVSDATEQTPLLDRKARDLSPSPALKSLLSRNSDDLTARSLKRTSLLLAISYASFSGIISGICLLFAKSGVQLLLLTFRGKNQFWRWEAWILVLGLIIFALLQLWYLHKALTLADPILVCPSAFCFYNLSSIINGLVYFDQFSLMSNLHLLLVVTGMSILLAGVWIISVQSGGGGVDIGIWNEEQAICSDDDEESRALDVEDEICLINDVETRSSEVPRNSIRTSGKRGGRFDVARRGRRAVSQVSLPPLPFFPDTDHLYVGHETLRPSHSHPSVRATSVSDYTGPHAPPHRRYSEHPLSLHLHPPHAHSTIGPGFQIGLSPLSPGFAIVPLERRRWSSSPGTANAVVEVQEAVSEREVRETGGQTAADVQGVRSDANAVCNTDGDAGCAWQRWTWVRRLFIR